MTLLDPFGREIDQPDIHDPQGVPSEDVKLLRLLVEELRALEREEPMLMALAPLSALQLAGLVQLALRHPGTKADIRATAERFLDGVREYFHDCPAVLLVLARGDDPTQDVPR